MTIDPTLTAFDESSMFTTANVAIGQRSALEEPTENQISELATNSDQLLDELDSDPMSK